MTTEMDSSIRTNFERLVMEHKSTIYSVCFMFTDCRADADDLFQEILINLWNGFESFRGEACERTWVYRVSMNTCITHKRKKRISTTPLEIAGDIAGEDANESRQTAQLHQRISRLEPMDRAIVLLWLENLPYAEIASIIGISTRALSVRLVRIKEKLKSL